MILFLSNYTSLNDNCSEWKGLKFLLVKKYFRNPELTNYEEYVINSSSFFVLGKSALNCEPKNYSISSAMLMKTILQKI